MRRQQSYDENYPGEEAEVVRSSSVVEVSSAEVAEEASAVVASEAVWEVAVERFPVLTPRMCHLCAINRFDTPSRILEENKTFT